MQNSDQDKQDQRNTRMGDSTAVTIEFLRARLLAERSVSRTARQRAEELAKRVMELEEQLRIVSVQRKKAERATAEVLAILETRGVISDFSEDYYSSSDQEATSCDGSRQGEVSVNSKLRGPDLEELSGTGQDPAISGRSLSWKGRKDSSRSLEKYKDSSIKRRNSFASAVPSSKHRPGKSCRQIKRREQRYESTERVNESIKVNYQESEAATSPERSSQITDIKDRTFKETAESQEDVPHNSLGPNKLEDDINVVNNAHELRTYGGESDMERALERQAQLIGQYEAMEKAQREWEERYGENNSSAPDSCDPGNHSDITEERDEIKSHALCPPVSVPAGAQEVNSTTEDACDGLSGTQPDDLPHISKARLSSEGHAHLYDSPDKNHDVAISNEKQKQDGAEISGQISSQGTHNNATLLQPSRLFSSPVVDTLPGEPSGGQTENLAPVPHETDGRLNGVLDALQHAKSMLQKKMSLEPTTKGGSVGKAVEPYLHNSNRMEKLDIPAGCPGLFRLPTDFLSETIKSDYQSPSARFSLTSYYPENGATLSTDAHYLNHRSMESQAGLPIFNKFLGNPMINAGPRTMTPQLPTDPYLDRIEPPPYTLPYTDHTIPPRYSPPISYPDLMPRTFASDGFPRTLSSYSARTLPGDFFLSHDGGRRTYMYR